MSMPGQNSGTLARRKCKPCEGGISVLPKTEVRRRLQGIKDWRLSPDAKSITADYLMKDFAAAVKLINAMAKIAEKEDHHPDIHLTRYRKLRVVLNTHAVNGLSENDFILAAKIESLPKKLKSS